VDPSRLGRGVLDTIRRRRLLGDGDRVAVALSGGPDSVALAWLLRDLEPQTAWRMAGLIHVHHGLRGIEADVDEAFCRGLAARMDLPVHVTHVDVGQLARDRRVSIEVAGREARYAAFETAAAALGATSVATGHTLDDQAETVLLRLLRGAGSRGLSAIRPKLGRYVRPLIDCRRAAILAYLDSRQEPFREDASNQDLSIPRNRIRRTLLPVLRGSWPGAVVALARFAELAADDEACLMALANAAGARVDDVDGRVALDLGALDALPTALGRRVIRGALEAAGGVPTFRDVEAVSRLARADKKESRLDLRALTVRRAGQRLRFDRAGGPLTESEGVTGTPQPLSVPGEVTLSETGLTIRASLGTRADLAARPSLAGPIAVLQADALPQLLAVRYRRPGDRLRPLGAPGTRKLQDWFVDRKVPRADRDRIPLVVDDRDRIVWVAGFTIAHEYRVTAPAEGVVVLELDKGNK
jgi:tRNA(Ile)-lysidine synthase